MEEVLKADPDYIIIGTQNAVGSQNADPIAEKIKSAPEWSTVKAVKEGRVYTNPVGTFLWARYSCEEALQVLWVAKLLHPDKFKDIDLTKQVRDFYKKFYDFDLSNADAERMLAGRDPL
jgi:iron complex transport system substrate-binding protein